MIQDGYLFKSTRLCIPKSGTKELLIQEVHSGSLAGPLWWKQDTINAPRTILLAKDVKRCSRHLKELCYLSGGQDALATARLVNVSMDFVLGMPKTQRNNDYIVYLNLLSLIEILNFWATSGLHCGRSLVWNQATIPLVTLKLTVKQMSLIEPLVLF